MKFTAKLIFIAVLILIYLPTPVLASHSISFDVDKPNGDYISGKDTINFTVTNTGNDDAYVACDYPMQAYTNPQGGQQNSVAQEPISLCYVLQGMPSGSLLVAYKLSPGDTHTWQWDQKDFSGSQVADGRYIGKISTDENSNTQSTTHTFQTSNFNIKTNNNAGGGGNGGSVVVPVCEAIKYDNPLGDFDTDGIYNWNDACPCLSGAASSNTGAGCPDSDVKKAAKDSATEIIGGEVAFTVVAGVALTAAAVAGAPFTGGASLIFMAAVISIGAEETITESYVTAGAIQQIAHDPPDPNYKEFVSLRPERVIAYDTSENKNFETTNKIISSGVSIGTSSDAFVRANEKFMGAQQVSDYYWMQVHAKEVRQYSSRLAQNIVNFNSATSELEKLTTQSGLNKIVTKNDLIAYQNKIKTNGVAALPQFERDLTKSLGGTDADVQRLADRILSVDPATWKDELLTAKSLKLKNNLQKFAESILSYSTNLGSNVVLGNFAQTAQNRFIKVLPVSLANTPRLAHTIIINIKYDAKNYKYSEAETAMNLSDASVSVAENTSGQLIVTVRSESGIPHGTSGTLLNLQFAARGWLGKLSVIAPWLRPSPAPIINGLAGDAVSWLYPTAINVKLPKPLFEMGQTQIMLNLQNNLTKLK